jgi:hypothetical protein
MLLIQPIMPPSKNAMPTTAVTPKEATTGNIKAKKPKTSNRMPSAIVKVFNMVSEGERQPMMI